MLKNINKKILILLGCGLSFVSCMEDQGNYDYKDINEVAFEGLEFEDGYSIPRFETFSLTPELIMSKDPDGSGKYSYLWQAFQNSGYGADRLTDLSTERNLNVTIDLLPGNYIIYYMVKDLETGVEWQTQFDLNVVNSIYEGWMVLNEVNGGSRLDMISKVEEEFIQWTDVLAVSGSQLELKGTPGFLYTYAYDPTLYGVYVSTSGNGTTKIDPNTFEWNVGLPVSNEFTTNQPLDLELDNMEAKSGSTCFAMVDGNAYFYYRVWNMSYNVPINQIGGERFDVSPMIGKGYAFGYSVLYDTTNKRFVRTYNGTTGVMPEKGLFDWNTGKDLVYMISNDYNGGRGQQTFAILKDPALDGAFYLAQFNAYNSNQVYYGEITATDFEQATNFAISPDYGYIFYSVGSKVYQYDFSLGTTKLMLDKGSEEISILKFHDFWNNNKYMELSSQLIVGSVDPAGTEGSNGTLEFYYVPPVNGQIELVNSYSGFGKIKSITYRER